ncbi:TPA: ead/Ea22-like family protein [Kluyvera ascorbata]|nr:ead/Ea22-like family protein [Kluyvera ascorbata]
MPFDTRIAALNEFLLTSCPANVLALVEALELSHRYIERLREWNANLAHESCEYQNRIAELESRTVTVKLPKRSVAEVMLLSGFDRQYAEGWCSGNDNAIHEMRAAGIQVIEGEGQ